MPEVIRHRDHDPRDYWQRYFAEQRSELQGKSAEDIRSEAHEIQLRMVHDYARLAARIARLRELGEDLSFLQVGRCHWLLLVADGKILPDALHHFCDRPLLMDAVARQALLDQKRLVNDEPIRIVRPDKSVECVLPSRLTNPNDIRQVFHKTHIRDEGEQVQYLHARQQEQAKNAAPVDPAAQVMPWEIRKHRVHVLRPTILSYNDLRNMLKLLKQV